MLIFFHMGWQSHNTPSLLDASYRPIFSAASNRCTSISILLLFTVWLTAVDSVLSPSDNIYLHSLSPSCRALSSSLSLSNIEAVRIVGLCLLYIFPLHTTPSLSPSVSSLSCHHWSLHYYTTALKQKAGFFLLNIYVNNINIIILPIVVIITMIISDCNGSTCC